MIKTEVVKLLTDHELHYLLYFEPGWKWVAWKELKRRRMTTEDKLMFVMVVLLIVAIGVLVYFGSH